MASKKKPPASPPAAPATKDEPPTVPTPNRLIVDEDGVHLESGQTRTVEDLTIDQYNAILPLLLQRQKLAIELTAALADLGFTVSVAKTIDDPGP